MKKMTYPFLLLLILSCQFPDKNTSNLEKPITNEPNIIQTDFSKNHKIDSNTFHISFSDVKLIDISMYPNHLWEFSKTKLSSIDEVSDSLIINSKYSSFKYKKIKDGKEVKVIRTTKVKKGDIIFAINHISLNNYYAIKILDSNENGVKLEYKLFKTKKVRFERYNTRQAINQIIQYNDLETLSKLSKLNPSALNECVRIDDYGKKNLLMHSIKQDNRMLFDELLMLNVDIDKYCYENTTPLLYACRKNRLYFVEKLLSIYKEKGQYNKLDKKAIECIKKRGKLNHLLEK